MNRMDVKKGMVTYIELCEDNMTLELFEDFQRKQNVTKCWRKVNDEWVINDIAFIDDWTEQEYFELFLNLKNTIQTNGFVVGAFVDGQLKGFASVEGNLFGSKCEYVNLSNIHVSKEMRGKGIGRELFRNATVWAKNYGAKKLYISAHSAIESQAFYHSMRCVEAKEYNINLVEKEPFDRQLEYIL